MTVEVSGFREWIARHLAADRERVVDAVVDCCNAERGPGGLAPILLAIAVSAGLRDERVFMLLIRELPHDPALCAGALRTYGDARALPFLEALFDRQPTGGPGWVRIVRALACAIVELGGMLTFERGAKVMAASDRDGRSRFLALLHEELARLARDE